jgi:iron(III) transport system substrate-binding protein
MLSSKYNGRIGVLDWNSSTTIIILVALLGQQYDKDYSISNAFNQLAALKPKFYPSQVPMLQDLGAGAIDSAVQAVASAVPLGAAIKVGYPKKPIGLPGFGSVTSWARHPNAAQLFVDYLMTKRGQTIWAAGSLATIPGTLGSTSVSTIIDTSTYTPDYFTAERATLESIFNR